ncbi:HNH endonuclease signature motif containing protein [Corynebacterium liangguodongii]|uniref:HNH endonuclease n=1 Tax=Corynebacterium liangguodongii TaxID=2079535 RepID=A0A2S0WH20_9CORY|nr:HNH endonuclease signature motif containing protein [Corynebacterium liangguodongii]AWB85063.1 HNH endonuclease [Corynebacterium liangguodongii]PWC00299.1 HNH endonuclease [Corynebacterium liangguodongii]
MEKDPQEHTPFFRTQRPGDRLVELAQRKRDIDHEVYSAWADAAFAVDDFDREITAIQEATGESRAAVEKAIFAYRRMADLPWLRSIQDATRVLDIKRLVAIDNVIGELGPDLTAEAFGVIDEFLATMFTPKRANQPLASPRAITARLRAFIARLDARVGFDAAKRARRARPAGTVKVSEYGGAKGCGVVVECDAATHAVMRAYRHSVAREHKVSEDEAMRMILTGAQRAEVKVTLFGFTPLDPDGAPAAGESVYFPGSGWTDAEGTLAAEELGGERPPRVVNLDEVAGHRVAGYVASTSMRAYALARDGVCLWPGCDRAAEACQLDHRIPYDAGGETTPSNLFTLCAHHHNAKTDTRAFYVPDPATGDVVWLFPDGTYALAEPEGFLAQQLGAREPRWSVDVHKRMRERDRQAAFSARGHKILDDFEAGGSYAECIRLLGELEKEFAMRFPIRPRPRPLYTPWTDERPEETPEEYDARIQRLVDSDPNNRAS